MTNAGLQGCRRARAFSPGPAGGQGLWRKCRLTSFVHAFAIGLSSTACYAGSIDQGDSSMLRRHVMVAGAAALGLGLAGARARAETLTEFRIGILGGENTQD